jgi:hypothetical protein
VFDVLLFGLVGLVAVDVGEDAAHVICVVGLLFVE